MVLVDVIVLMRTQASMVQFVRWMTCALDERLTKSLVPSNLRAVVCAVTLAHERIKAASPVALGCDLACFLCMVLGWDMCKNLIDLVVGDPCGRVRCDKNGGSRKL